MRSATRPPADVTVPAAGAPIPAWAVLQRRVLAAVAESTEAFLARYVRGDGGFTWRDEFPGRDGLDDGYEPYWNWPIAYLFGADERLLAAARHGWEGVTRQFERYGQALDGYERGYDWFHQAEGNMLLYSLGLTDGGAGTWRERIERFARLFVEPEHGNYDAALGIFRGAHTGAGGARFEPYRYSAPFTDGEALYEWSSRHEPYGLPLLDVPGIEHFDDLKSADAARRMGEAMNDRMARGDVAVSMGSAGLVGYAFLLTGDERYREWIADYLGGWLARARANGGLVPDNVGQNGEVGEYHEGRWYGGLYGWAWPHGLTPICSAALVGASVAQLVTGDDAFFELPRGILRRVVAEGREVDGTFVVPHRYGPSGWFDFQPLPVSLVIQLAYLSGDDGDRAFRDEVMRLSPQTADVARGPGRFADVQSASWTRYLAGENPRFPEAVLEETLAEVNARLDQIRADTADLSTVHLHHWQHLNPVVTEGLIQLAGGGPSPVYNGGMLRTRFAYRDEGGARPGLPSEVAALVSRLDPRSATLTLVNTSVAAARTVRVLGGHLGEHVFTSVRFTRPALAAAGYPAEPSHHARPEVPWEHAELSGERSSVLVRLEPGAVVTLEIESRPVTPTLPISTNTH